MGRFIRIALVLVVPLALLIAIPAVFARVDDTQQSFVNNNTQPKRIVNQIDLQTDDTFADSKLLATENVTMTIKHSPDEPVFVGQEIEFTVAMDVNKGAQAPSTFDWFFGDGGKGDGMTIPYTYTKVGIYTVTVWGVYPSADPISTTKSIVVLGTESVFLPVIFNNYEQPPDLICESVKVLPDNPVENEVVGFSVEIESKFNSADGFWVHLFVDLPEDHAPPTVNATLREECESPCKMIAWKFSENPILAGQKINLVSSPDTEHPYGYSEIYSTWDKRLSAGDHTVHVLVDSVGLNTQDMDGTVAEESEDNNVCPPETVSVSAGR